MGKKIVLTNENYYSQEADMEYMSCSLYKDMCGTMGFAGCERTAIMRLKGLYPKKEGTPLLVGGYVDAWFEGTLDSYKENHPEMFKKDGTLKADFVKADAIIERVQRDPLFMYYMSGNKQVIMTGEIDGIPWKIKIDSLLPDTIVDLKVMADIEKNTWVQDLGEYLPFPLMWGYDIQGAVYQEIVYQNIGKRLPFVIAAVSKEEEPNLELIDLDQPFLDDALRRVKENQQRAVDVRSGIVEPTQCYTCPCCRRDKVLTGAIKLSQIFNQK